MQHMDLIVQAAVQTIVLIVSQLLGVRRLSEQIQSIKAEQSLFRNCLDMLVKHAPDAARALMGGNQEKGA